MTQEILNPVRLPKDLNWAERRLVRCLRLGKPCVVGDGNCPDRPIEHGYGANVIRGEIIRFFVFGGGGANPVLGPSIFLHGAFIREPVDLFCVRAPYILSFSNCHFLDLVYMSGAECTALSLGGSRLTKGLTANGLTTRGDVLLHGGIFVNGEVQLLNANIDGKLVCSGGDFHNPGGCALNASGLTTKGDVFLDENFTAEGEVRLLGSNIGGHLSCESGIFSNPNKKALSIDGLTTIGDVRLRNGFSASGEVRLLGANIGTHLDCSSGKFHNPNNYALVADSLTTKGGAFFRDGFIANGEVRLLVANIGGNLDCSNGEFDNPGGYALNAEAVKIRGALLWHDIVGGAGIVHLSYTRANVLSDDQASWRPFEAALRGFSYDYLSNFENIEFRIEWLSKRPEYEEFSPLPYEQAAKTLFGMGHIDDAQKILLKMERLQTSELNFGLRKIGRWIWDGLAGYGYRWRRTVYEMLGIVIVGAVLFSCADESKRMVPHQPAVLSNAKYQETAVAQGANPKAIVAELFPEYPEFNALLYSVDVFIPFFALHQEPYWYPKPSREDPFWIRYLLIWYWIEIAAGWVLTSLLLLSITGLLRPRQEPGGRG